MVKYILASNSPRRRELLEQAGICFEISPAQGEEISTGDLPADIVEELSCKKAAEVAQRYLQKYENDTVVIIGADTVVACQGEIMGKPRDQADASAMLAKLQGGMHQVYTGVTFIVLERGQGERGQKAVTFHERTDVSMYPMTGTDRCVCGDRGADGQSGSLCDPGKVCGPYQGHQWGLQQRGRTACREAGA